MLLSSKAPRSVSTMIPVGSVTAAAVSRHTRASDKLVLLLLDPRHFDVIVQPPAQLQDRRRA